MTKTIPCSKLIVAICLLLTMVCCKSNIEPTDYFGQPNPGNIPEIFAPSEISIKGRFEHGISFTPNGRELAFGILDKNDFTGIIYHSEKIDTGWMKPSVFAPLENESTFLPYFSPDGKSLVYAQDKPDTITGLTDIWILNKTGNSWVNPQKMNNTINTLTREANACMTMDRKIYFSSNREGNGLADLYCSAPENGEYVKAEVLDAITTISDEESIFVAPNEDYIIFCTYTGDKNGADLFIGYKDYHNNWTDPTLLDSTINSSAWERRPFVSIDNNYLFYTRLTFDEKGVIETDIYWVNTTKVFKPYVYHPLPDTTLVVGEKMKLSVPKNYFLDIDNHMVSIKMDSNNISWLKYDADKMTLSGTPDQKGEFEVRFTALDTSLNTTVDIVRIIVTN